jgi:diguanylate cyclase (GGDEF)-like protein/PAS domain S-box-containing protein
MPDAMASPPQTTDASEHRGPAAVAAPDTGDQRIAGPWILAALVAAATWISIELTRVEGGVASVWIANGLIVAALLVAPRTRWSVLLLAGIAGTMAGRIIHGDAVWRVVGMSLANLVEVGLIAGVVRSRIPSVSEAGRLRALAGTAMASTAVACAVSATLAYLILRVFADPPFLSVWPAWFIAHVLGMVIVATVGVTALQLGWRVLGRRGRRLDYLACVCLLLLTFWIEAVTSLPLQFLVYLPLLLLVYRHGFAGVVSGTLALSIAGGFAAAYGIGTFELIGDASVTARALLLQVFVGAGCLVSFPLAVGLAERRRMTREIAQKESRYRLLAEHSRDLIVRLRADGEYLYVSPAASALLGWTPEELMAPRWELVHPNDRARFQGELSRLFRYGGSVTTTYRARHRDGHYVWIEAVAQRVDAVDPPEVVYAGRDVTERVASEQALLESQMQLQAISDNVPAMIAHFDTQERFTFANRSVERMLGHAGDQLLGRTLREVRGEEIYAGMAGHVRRVLDGEPQSFEGRAHLRGRDYDHRTQFVPDRDTDGDVRGFYSITFDISALKRAERELTALARVDTLTGLANRRHFEERLAEALQRAQRQRQPLGLLVLDLDRFKAINDTHGHAVGDAVLKAFAERIAGCVYEVDLPARLGGDEFVVLLELTPTEETAARVAQRIVEATRLPLVLESTTLHVSTSIGVGIHYPVRDTKILLELADQALYDAKAAGRDTWRVRSG